MRSEIAAYYQRGLEAARPRDTPLWMMAERVGQWVEDPGMLRWLREVEEEPSLLGSSSHLMTICRRPRAS